MKYIDRYKVQFSGLNHGEHQFEFDVNDDFFACFDESEIKQGDLHVDVKLKVGANNLIFYFDINGKVKLTCDLCLDEFYMPIKTNAMLTVNFGDTPTDITDVDDVMTLLPGEHEIDLSQHIYEYINLSIPMRRVHPDDEHGNPTCNAEMMKLIDNYSVKEEREKTVDPRWEKLKSLYN